jgi:hypothetical protein
VAKKNTKTTKTLDCHGLRPRNDAKRESGDSAARNSRFFAFKPSFCLDAKRSKKSRLYPRGYLLWLRSLNKIKLASLKQYFVPGVHCA